jgi:MerR family transcriptional regulator, light-induced transcriptional regulator
MANYSIKDLEALTGIKAHTIRIWEKRHNIISPERSSTNIRSYSDDDLKRILNISILYNQGYKISKIAALSGDQLVNKVTELSNDEKPENEVFIDQLTISMVELDELKFEKLLSSCILKYGFEDTMLKVVYPFLRKIGVLWLSNNINPAQEHFMSNLVRQKIIVAIDGLDNHVRDNAKTVVLFLPEHELHELGLLFFHYLIKKKGYKTYYLGQNVPFIDLKKVCGLAQPDILISSVSYVSNDKQLLEYVHLLSDTFKGQDIYLTGKPLIDRMDLLPKSLIIFDSPNTLTDSL